MNIMTKPNLNLVFASGHRDALPLTDDNRRFFAVDPVKLMNDQLHAERLQAHADFLTAQQRASGVRARLCSTGCYSLYDAEGHYIGRSAPARSPGGVPQAKLGTVAARMAYSEELASSCRQADRDYEASGTVSAATIAGIRALLGRIDAA
jgi:hypothetical protein